DVTYIGCNPSRTNLFFFLHGKTQPALGGSGPRYGMSALFSTWPDSPGLAESAGRVPLGTEKSRARHGSAGKGRVCTSSPSGTTQRFAPVIGSSRNRAETY